DMQSIYAFRGAHLGNILGFEHHFPPAARLTLSVNRRSGPEIVTLANAIQGQVPRALPKSLRALADTRPATIECFLAADDREEAAEIADEIRALGGPWREKAVLCRKRRALIPVLVEALEARGVPVRV